MGGEGRRATAAATLSRFISVVETFWCEDDDEDDEDEDTAAAAAAEDVEGSS